MKLACVVQRYGDGVVGGSEAHCRALAERLAVHHDVTVLTSCARDYITWRNELPAGERIENGVRVRRFKARPRRMHRFREVSERVFSGEGSEADEEAWFRENGPQVPELLDHLDRRGGGYDRVLFWTYRYYPSFFGLPLVADRAILLPTAEEDPAIRLEVLRDYFRLPTAMLFLTPEEGELVRAAAGGVLPPSAVVGAGLEPPEPAPAVDLAALGVADEFVLYLGRVDPNKGCLTMLRYFEKHLAEGGRPVQLVLAGRPVMSVPDHPAILALGFVEAAVREALLGRARLLLMPSPYESLSLVLLEAWNHGRPALVNGCCRVLKGQVLRADGGLYYTYFPEFTAALDLLLEEPETAELLGRQGREYVERTYRWPRVFEKLESFLDALPRTPALSS